MLLVAMQECLLLAGQQSCWDKFNGNTIKGRVAYISVMVL